MDGFKRQQGARKGLYRGSQHALKHASLLECSGAVDSADRFRRISECRREYVYKALNDIPGISAVKPKAAFYIFPKIDTARFNITNDEQFALDLLREKKILIIHGGGFNWGQPDHFRVVYLPRIEVLKDAVGKITDFLSYYHQ